MTLEFQTGKQRNELKHNLTTIIESDVRQLFNDKNQINMLDEKIPKKTFSKCNASVTNMTQQNSSMNKKQFPSYISLLSCFLLKNYGTLNSLLHAKRKSNNISCKNMMVAGSKKSGDH